jgi:hypothetical protein
MGRNLAENVAAQAWRDATRQLQVVAAAEAI